MQARRPPASPAAHASAPCRKCRRASKPGVWITDESDRRGIALALIDAEIYPDQIVEVVVRSRRLRARIVRYHGRSEAPPYFRSTPLPATPVAETLANQTMLGAARMLCETGTPAAELRANVTTPAGTTAAGLGRLEHHAVRAALADAVRAATERSRELGA